MKAGRWIAAGLGIAAMGAAAVYAQYRNTEEPEFALVRAEGDFELRDYPALVVAEVTSRGDRQRASGASFRRLAAYIFAQDRPAGGESIAMTAPVIQQETGAGAWRMRFVMPAKYTLATLPPAPADITLTEVPARRMAAVRFSGNGGSAELASREASLRRWLEAQGLTASGEAEFAFYDAPMVPGPLRRNEVLIPVAAE
jgi:DNA gyrase inhibitor GyrI